MNFSKNLTKRLVQAKQVFLHGCEHVQKKGELDRLLAILSFDQAIELFLSTVIDEMGGKIKLQDPFEKIFDEADRILKELRNEDLPDKISIIRKVHNPRNNAQHHGNIPSEEDLITALHGLVEKSVYS